MQLVKLRILLIIGWFIAVAASSLLAIQYQVGKTTMDYESGVSHLVSETTRKICEYASNSQKQKIVVIDNLTSLDSAETTLISSIHQDIENKFLQNDCKLIVSDRTGVFKMFEESQLVSKKLAAPNGGPMFGKLLSPTILISGQVRLSEDFIRIDIKAVDLEQGVLITNGSITRTQNQVVKSYQKRYSAGVSGKTLSEEVEEPVTNGQLVSDFFVTNWGWIWAVIILPLLTWSFKLLGFAHLLKGQSTNRNI
ncbi:hypothetical protein [Dyadobacter psychrotolerans]|uniref:Uncharacterized protein n=1 Tax=Dyadobacter psychrotolerans TaxID=2541721 RepID=A0A4R5DF78_9BACT|nr:hypothetical protein [Dyadobacter psychrotolerans]TDE09023.1 hypothetical protein E0F88_31570 [Dyadobacter psychrotolerans]